MKDVYETIEIQFYKDLKASEKEYLEHKSIVEEVMKSNSVDYALEIVENQRRSYHEEVYEKGYTLNLIVRKIDLHYVLKLLDQNKIGFYATKEEKWEAIKENEIDEEEYYEEEQPQNYEFEEEIIKSSSIDEEEIKRLNEQGNFIVKVIFSVIFVGILMLDLLLIYFLESINNQKYLVLMMIFTVAQVFFFMYFLGKFRNKVDRL